MNEMNSKTDSHPFELRTYQKKIINEIGNCNVIVLLPTGAGKTVIPAEFIRLYKKRTIFFVPTCNLVGQQAQFFRSWCGVGTVVGEYFGGRAMPQHHLDVLVSTPKAFQIAQVKDPTNLSWNTWDLIVFDEVHHVLKQHPYRKLALSVAKANTAHFSSGSEGKQTQIIGLTASLSYAVTDSKIHKSIETLMYEMQMDKLCTASKDELVAGGYHGNTASPEVVAQKVIDLQGFCAVDPCLHPVRDRKPHLLLQTFWGRFQTGKCTVYAKDILSQIKNREEIFRQLYQPNFVSPLETKKKLADWGASVHKQANAKRQRPEIKASLLELEQWYESLRILVSSWEENKECSVLFLKMMLTPEQQTQSEDFFERYDTADIYVRLEQLKEVLLTKISDAESSTNAEFRGIIFVQQRVTTHIVNYFILQDVELVSKLSGIAPLYAVTSPATPSLSINKRQSDEALKRFRSGEINLLITTVVAEEGLDVPTANCVVRYDPVLNAVSHVQGRGRARQADSSFIILQEREDRPTAMLQEVEQRQLHVASNFKTDMNDKEKTERQRKEIESQKYRERAGLLVIGKGGEQDALQDLNIYCQKTKAQLEEAYSKERSEFVCTLRYETVLRNLRGTGRGEQKKAAKRNAAGDLIQKLNFFTNTN